MITIKDKSICSGCGVCSVVCPQNCITMEEDVYGFSFPVADVSACIQCGRCDNICPWNKNFK